MFFQGVFSVLPTPFSANGDIDFVSLRKVVDLYIRGGANGLAALGVTSEVARLTEKERFEVLDAILDHVKGRLPVVAGATAAVDLPSVVQDYPPVSGFRAKLMNDSGWPVMRVATGVVRRRGGSCTRTRATPKAAPTPTTEYLPLEGNHECDAKFLSGLCAKPLAA